MITKRIEFDYENINKINYILKNNEITYKEFDKNVIYEFTYEEGNFPKKLNYYKKITSLNKLVIFLCIFFEELPSSCNSQPQSV